MTRADLLAYIILLSALAVAIGAGVYALGWALGWYAIPAAAVVWALTHLTSSPNGTGPRP